MFTAAVRFRPAHPRPARSPARRGVTHDELYPTTCTGHGAPTAARRRHPREPHLGAARRTSTRSKVIRSKAYLSALIFAGILGIPISAVAYGFLALVVRIQHYVFTDLPADGDGGPRPRPGGRCPGWCSAVCSTGADDPVPARATPGTRPPSGSRPAAARRSGRELIGVFLAALTTLSLGAVLGPEAPLIAIGGGLGALAVHLAKKDAPPMALTVMASAGSFAAISTLLGSPILGAFLIMEAAGDRRRHVEPGRAAGSAGLRHRCADLRRAGLLDRTRRLLAGADHGPAARSSRRWPPWAGRWRWAGRRPAGLADPLGRAVAAADRASQPGAGDGRPRPADRADRDGVPADQRQQLHPGAVLRPGRAARTWWRTPPTTRSAILLSCWSSASPWPTACRSARSAAGRCSRRCSSARRSASPPAGCPGWSLAPGHRRWASARCAPPCCGCR